MSNYGRKLRRQQERQAKIQENKESTRYKPAEITQMKKEIREQTSMYNVDMMLMCIALTEHRLYGFGSKRIYRTLEYIDSLMGDILENKATMGDYERALEEETGIRIVSSGRTLMNS